MIKRSGKKIKVLLAAAEAAPLAKVGGLSDVIGSLPGALNKIGCDARVIIPKYGFIEEKKYALKKVVSGARVRIGSRFDLINIWETRKAIPGTIVYLIENERFAGVEIYRGDNARRFFFFSAACLEALPLLGFTPDIIHCHDFHTAPILPLLKTGNYPWLKSVKTVYTIHNLAYQGKAAPAIFDASRLAAVFPASIKRDAADGDINLMVQGIVNCDLFNTVSPAYAREIGSRAQGAGLAKVVRTNRSKLSGIINGLDTDFFDPARDKFLRRQYSLSNLSGKAVCKADLQRILGLPAEKNIALVGFISRLVEQKGLELITDNLIKRSNCQFVFLGTGEKRYEKQLKKLAQKYPDKVSVQITFDIVLAQKIYAGSDIFLMPSRFEPCGLGQMISMRYGTIVVARSTGGLKDTVSPECGFTFKDFKKKALFKSLNSALFLYYNSPKKWLKLQKNSFKKDFSWDRSAREYLRLYKKALALK